MKRMPIIFACLLNTFLSFSQSVDWQWARCTSGPGYQNATGMAHDSIGHIYLVGQYDAALCDFGDTSLLNPNTTDPVFFIAKYSDAGNLLWARQATVPAGTVVYAVGVAVDHSGNAYVIGFYDSGPLTIGNITLPSADTDNIAGTEIFIAKYDSAGNVQWAKGISSVNNANASYENNISGITTDNAGNSYITGSFTSDSLTFGSHTLYGRSNNGFSSTFFLVKYDPSGNVVWARTTDYGSSGTAGKALATDEKCDVYVTGSFAPGTILFNNITLTNSGSGTYDDIFLAKYDSSGNIIWADAAGGRFEDLPASIAIDASANVYITGYFISDTINFGPYNLFNTTTGFNINGNTDFFIAKYSPVGNVLWVKGATGSAANEGLSVAAGTGDNVFVTGGFSSQEFIFDSDTLLPPAFFNDPMFILKLDPDGNELCTTSLGSAGGGSLVCTDPAGNAYVGGSFNMNSFIVGADTFALTGVYNVVVAKFNCNNLPADIQSVTRNYNLMLFPNPFTNQATVQYTLPEDSKNAVLIIYDMPGRERSSYPLNNSAGEISINANNLSSGVYLYSLVVDGKVAVTRKMVVEE